MAAPVDPNQVSSSGPDPALVRFANESDFSNPVKDSDGIQILYLNVDSNNQFERGPMREYLPAFSITQRMPAIVKFVEQAIEKESIGVFCFLELRTWANLDGTYDAPIALLVDTLLKHGFGISTAQYNPDPGSFHYMVAYDRERFAVTGTRSHYLTKNGGRPTPRNKRNPADIKSDNYGEDFERSVYTVDLYERKHELTHRIGVFHPGFSLAHRMATADLLRVIAAKSEYPCIFGGDYNSFPDAGGAEQIAATLKGNVLQHATRNILDHTTHHGADTTFVNFPYDFGANAAKVPRMAEIAQGTRLEVAGRLLCLYDEHNPGIGGVLDHCFCTENYKVLLAHVYAPYLEALGIRQLNRESIKRLVIDKLRDGGQPALFSDHLPVSVLMSYPVKPYV